MREAALRCLLKIAKFVGIRFAIGDSGGIDNDREVLIMTKVMSSKCVVGKWLETIRRQAPKRALAAVR